MPYDEETNHAFIERLMEQSRSLFGNADLEPTATDAVEHDVFDDHDYRALKRAVPNIDNGIDRLQQDYGHVDDLYRDLFNALHLSDPTLRDKAAMDPRFLPNHSVVSGWSSASEWQDLRTGTLGDNYGTAMALIGLEPAARVALEALKEAQERADEAAEARKAAEEAKGDLDDALQDALGGTSPMQMPELEDLMDKAEQAAGAAAGAQAEAESAANAGAAAGRQAARQAAQDASDALDEEEALFGGFGVDPGELQKMSFDERFAKAKMLRGSRLAEFAKLIGQFKNVQQAESRRKIEHVPDEIVNVELGNDLMRLTPGELEAMAIPELEPEFWSRYTESTLLQYKLGGREKVGKGPIICVVDESGSMQARDVMNGTREAWSKALVLALLDQARQQQRDFHYIGFADASSVWHKSFENGQARLEDIVEVTEHFFSGGTHYEKPLNLAAEIVSKYHNVTGKGKPDIVFMSDDEYGSMPEAFLARWQQVKAATQLRCFGIAIGCAVGMAMEAVSDNVRAITELVSDPRVVGDLFRTI